MSWTMELVLVLSSLLSHSTLVSLKSSISASESDFTEVRWSSLQIKMPNYKKKKMKSHHSRAFGAFFIFLPIFLKRCMDKTVSISYL